MVIRTEESGIGKKYEAEVAKLEEIIDEELKKGNDRIALPPPPVRFVRFRKKMIKEIKEKYTHAGWRVKLCEEAGDGPYPDYEYLLFTDPNYSGGKIKK